MTPPPPNWACPFGLTVSHPREHPAPATVISREKRSLQSLRPVWMIRKRLSQSLKLQRLQARSGTREPVYHWASGLKDCHTRIYLFSTHEPLNATAEWTLWLPIQPFRQLRQLLSTSTPGAGALNGTGWQHQSVVFSAYKSFEIKMLARIGSGLSKSIRLSVPHVFHPGNQQKLIRCKPQFPWNGTE